MKRIEGGVNGCTKQKKAKSLDELQATTAVERLQTKMDLQAMWVLVRRIPGGMMDGC